MYNINYIYPYAVCLILYLIYTSEMNGQRGGHDNGHLVGHYPAYTMAAYQRKKNEDHSFIFSYVLR